MHKPAQNCRGSDNRLFPLADPSCRGFGDGWHSSAGSAPAATSPSARSACCSACHQSAVGSGAAAYRRLAQRPALAGVNGVKIACSGISQAMQAVCTRRLISL